MKTTAYLPVGTSENSKQVLVTKGDVLELVSGEKVTFTEMKRVRFIGTLNGKGISVPIYRNKYDETPYVVKITGEKDKTVLAGRTSANKLKYGNLFALEGHKETFMYVGKELKRGNEKIVAVDLATNKRFTIGTGFNLVKISVPKIRTKFPAI